MKTMIVRDSSIHLTRKHALRILGTVIVVLFILLLRWTLLGMADNIVEEHKHPDRLVIYKDSSGRSANEKSRVAEQETLPRKAKIKCRKNTQFRIPNIIHHVWFGNRELLFHHYLSLR